MFGIDAYRNFINCIHNSSKIFSDFFDAAPGTVTLRHDIDFSLDAALSIAQLDKEMNISSSFFFMMSSNMYNLMSPCSREKVLSIAEMGHRISLHFDPTAYSDMDAGFFLEKDIFESLFNVSLDIVSLHRPGKFLVNNNKKLCNVDHTYEDKYFKNMVYLSDSAGKDCRIEWAHIKNKSLESNSPIQLLLHPIWWNSISDSPTQTLTHFLNQNSQFLCQETKLNCKSFYPNF